MRWFRWFHLLTVVAVVCGVGVLSLSDSIVVPADEVLSVFRRLAQRLASGGAIEVGRPSLPFGTDKVMHFGGWAGVGFLACGLLTPLAERINLLLGLVTLSAFFEVGQHYLTSSRSAELSDLVANAAGLTLGFTAFAIVEHTVGIFFPELGAKTEALLRRRLRFS